MFLGTTCYNYVLLCVVLIYYKYFIWKSCNIKIYWSIRVTYYLVKICVLQLFYLRLYSEYSNIFKHDKHNSDLFYLYQNKVIWLIFKYEKKNNFVNYFLFILKINLTNKYFPLIFLNVTIYSVLNVF